MPVEFLSVEQGAGFGRFAGEPSQSDLDRFFYLDVLTGIWSRFGAVITTGSGSQFSWALSDSWGRSSPQKFVTV